MFKYDMRLFVVIKLLYKKRNYRSVTAHVKVETLLIFRRRCQEDEDKEEEVNSGSECGDDVEVDVCAIERIPALCSRYW